MASDIKRADGMAIISNQEEEDIMFSRNEPQSFGKTYKSINSDHFDQDMMDEGFDIKNAFSEKFDNIPIPFDEEKERMAKSSKIPF